MTDPAPAKPVVWIVDDSPLDLERVRRALGGAHQLRLFADGSAALESLDSGSPPDVLILDWVFDRFSRAPQTQGVAGSGLGLMIARQIVEAHGGSIGVESQLGEGSSFWFRLPRTAQLT